MVNFRDRLFPRSKSHDERGGSLPRSGSSSPTKQLKDVPPSSRSYTTTRTFSLLGRSPSPSRSQSLSRTQSRPNTPATTTTPSPTFMEWRDQQKQKRTRNVSGTSTGFESGGSSPLLLRESRSRSLSRSRSGSPAAAVVNVRPSPAVDRAHSLWSWKIEEPSLRTDEIDYSEYKECHGCKKPIYQDMVQLEALNKLWHPECFHCSICAKILAPPEKFMELKGIPYCEHDYNEQVYPKCYVCTKTIFEREVRVLQRSYHPDCFTCRKCSEPLCPYSGNYVEKNGTFYCEYDYYDLFAPKCYECDQPIKDERNMTRALGTTYHREHFVCFECKNPLPGNNVWRKHGNFYCEEDYHKLFSPVCAGCFEPIRHNGVAALGRNWHGDCCLRCGACEKVLKPDNYVQVNEKAYCRNDWVKLFGPKCAYCRQPIFEVLRGENVIAMGLDYHPACFRCYQCMCLLTETTFYEHNGRPYCHEHYHAKTCVDCIKKEHHEKHLRQQSVDRTLEQQIYGVNGKKKEKIKRKDTPRPGSAGAASSATRYSSVSFLPGRPTSKQELHRSRSFSPIDYIFRPKSSQSQK